eukprot:1140311-Pelagomonas_calceolata.AAC.2
MTWAEIYVKVSEEHAVPPYMAAQQRSKEFVREHDLRNRPHALIWLSKVYGNPAGMCACQVWVPNINEKAVSSKAICKKGNHALYGVF